MIKWTLRALLMMGFLFTLPTMVLAQEAEGGGEKHAEGIGKKDYDKMAAKKAKKEKKEVAKEEKRLLRQHRKHQDKATQKRMKRNQRNAFRNGNGQPNEPFLRRLFGHKH